MQGDLNGCMQFSQEIPFTNQRPVIVTWSLAARLVLLQELTVTWEDSIDEAQELKMKKYKDLDADCQQRDWKVWSLPVEVGFHGFVGQSMWRALWIVKEDPPNDGTVTHHIPSRCIQSRMDDQWLIAAIYYIVKGVYFLYTQCVGVPIYVTFHILLLPLRFLHPRLFWNIDAHLFKAVLGGVTSWFYTDGIVLKESGDSLKDILDDRALLLCNHQSTADIGVIMQSLHPKGMVTGHMTWVMDHVFRLTHFGWVSRLHGDFFLKQPCRTVSERTKQMNKLKSHLKTIYLTTLKKWIVLFPEGGFLSTRKSGNQRYAKKHGLPMLENVCLPRLGVTKTILDELAPKEDPCNFKDNSERLNWIIDMTIAYPKGEAPNALILMFSMGKFPPIHIHYRVFNIQNVPRDENGLTKWMYDRYVEKEAMLDHFYNTGVFAKDGKETVDTDKLGSFIYVIFYSLWMWWLALYVYAPIFSLLSWKLIFIIMFCYVLYFTYDFIKYFRDFAP